MRHKTLKTILVGASLLLAACDNDVSFSPTMPRVSPTTNVGERILEISGTLSAEGGRCLEATILYDGDELDGARVTCPQPDGCRQLHLSGAVRSGSGFHRISFQVVRQSQRALMYEAQGTVFIDRPELGLGGVLLNLGPRRERLRARQSVTFEIDLAD